MSFWQVCKHWIMARVQIKQEKEDIECMMTTALFFAVAVLSLFRLFFTALHPPIGELTLPILNPLFSFSRFSRN